MDEPASDPAAEPTAIERGRAAILSAVRLIGGGPGVYRMLDGRGDALYIGKAKNLKRRVAQYAQLDRLPIRLRRMVAEVRRVETTRTHTEVEALLLESNLVKRLQPRFNVLLRDDKSFPYILLRADHEFPAAIKYRGTRDPKQGAPDGEFFGPFASAGAVNRTLTGLQRAFLLRNCSDAVFASRRRPCLQFQIKRCTAPCVGLVSGPAYAEQVGQARAFLTGRSHQVQADFAERMRAASDALEFETAARLRDRIRALTAIQAHQDINLEGDLGDVDAIAAWRDGGAVAIQVVFYRAGRHYGARDYFPGHDRAEETADVLAAFIGQFYDAHKPPPLVLISEPVTGQPLLAEALTTLAGRKVVLTVPQRGDKKRVIDQAQANAKAALARRRAELSGQAELLDRLAALLDLGERPARIEVYDNSHVSGSSPVGVMIVAGPDGFRKSDYRKFTIKGAMAAGDDYAMMREVMTRRFARAQSEDPDRSQGQWPDLVMLDGGKGQLTQALDVLAELGIADQRLVAIAKGPDRNAGRERLFLPGRAEAIELATNDPLLYLLQRWRDEAHRFAIGAHRAKRQKALGASPLDQVPGIGPRRKKALLLHFGSARAVGRAGLADLEAVPGVSRAMARSIYNHFHETD